MNEFGDPIVGADSSWWKQESGRLQFDPVILNDEKMRHEESRIPSICERGNWKLHTCAAGPDHVHVLLTTGSEADAVRKWFKRWLGEALSARWPLPNGASWWAEGGSVKWVWKQDYFEKAFSYIHDQRATASPD